MTDGTKTLRRTLEYFELARAVGVDGADHQHALRAAEAAVKDANAWAEGHPMLKQMVAEVARLTKETEALNAKLAQQINDTAKVLAQAYHDIDPLVADRDSRFTEEEVRRACINHCAGGVEEAIAELRALRGPPEPPDIHCPGTDHSCERACKTRDCEIMVEQEKVRHGCG